MLRTERRAARAWRRAAGALVACAGAAAGCAQHVSIGDIYHDDGGGAVDAAREAASDGGGDGARPDVPFTGVCDPLAQNCPDGGMCLVPTSGANVCVPPGSTPVGTACRSTSECTLGALCGVLITRAPPFMFSVDPTFFARTSGQCMQLCPAGDASGCGPGAQCATIENMDGTLRADVGLCYTP